MASLEVARLATIRLQIESKIVSIVRTLFYCLFHNYLSVDSFDNMLRPMYLNIDNEWRFSLSSLMTHGVRVLCAK
jgi:hypothetical protein